METVFTQTLSMVIYLIGVFFYFKHFKKLSLQKTKILYISTIFLGLSQIIGLAALVILFIHSLTSGLLWIPYLLFNGCLSIMAFIRYKDMENEKEIEELLKEIQEINKRYISNF